MNVIETIRSGFAVTCVSKSLERPGCTIALGGTPGPRLFIDLDLPGSPLGENAVRCDYLAFVDNVNQMLCVAPVEFKRTWRTKMIKQLQAGAHEAEKHVPSTCECRLRPVGVFERFSPKGKRRAVRQLVSFRGRKEPIRILACSGKLVDALRK